MRRLAIALWPGPGIALLSAFLFGASTPAAKASLDAVSPLLLAGLLYLGAGFGLATILAVRKFASSEEIEAPLRKADLAWLAAIVLAGGVIGPALLMFGLAQTEAATASLLLNLESVATLAIAWLVFRENVDGRLLVGAAAIVAGAALLSWSGWGKIGWGSLAVAGACLAWGIDNNLTRKLSGGDPVQIAAAKGLAAGAVNTTLALSVGAELPAVGAVAGVAVIGFFGYGLSLALFVGALRHLGAARTGAYFSTAPFIGAALAIPLFGEPITWQMAAAGALMAAGVWLHLSERHEHEHPHEEMAHEHRHVHDEHHRHEHAADWPEGEPHTHWHVHAPMIHRHPHYPDLHHRHSH